MGKIRKSIPLLVYLMTGTGLLVVGFLLLRYWGFGSRGVQPPRFTIGKETTYVNGPLDKDGYIDYETALNDRLGNGVTPATNSNVLIWQTLGPRPEGSMPAEYFQWLGMEMPPDQGNYFIRLRKYTRDKLQIPPVEEFPLVTSEEVDPALTRTTQRRWSAKEEPIIAGWLEANEKPLALAIEATKRPDYYNPLVTRRTKHGPGSLIDALVPTLQPCQELASALAARALLRVHEGKIDEAWQDLLACHRLGRLLARGGTLLEAMIAFRIDQLASNADLALVESAQLSANHIQACLRDLQQLPAMPPLADKVDLMERFTFLQSVLFMNRDDLWSGPTSIDPNSGRGRGLEGINWDPALSNGNLWYDRVREVFLLKDCMARRNELDLFQQDLAALKGNLPEEMRSAEMSNLPGIRLAKSLFGKEQPDEAISKTIGDMLICLLLSHVWKVQDAADQNEQVQHNVQVAFALAAYRADHRRYPLTLDALAPKYLKLIPGDLFTGNPLIYRQAGNGYLLYSVGPNGFDDDGRGLEDDPPGDDLCIRMPVRELKRN
jgi:hypothetical protein